MNLEENSQERINRLLDLYFSRETPEGPSPELEASVRRWFEQDSYVKEKYAALEKVFKKRVQPSDKPSIQAVESWLNVMDKLGLSVSDEMLSRFAKRPNWVITLRRLALRVAAVVLPVLIVVGVYMWQSQGSPEMAVQTVPAGVSMLKVELADGTQVWLRNGSKLEYPAEFGRKRAVTVTGEAFFDVAHDAKHPFIVQTDKVTVCVTGTEFNVSAWPGDENVDVTLHKGSVKVKADSSWTQIKPGQQFELNASTHQSVTREVDLNQLDWRHNELKYVDMTLNEIFAGMGKVYGIGFDFKAPLSNERYMVSFPAGEELHRVLSVLKAVTGEFDFDITADKVIINKPNE